MKPVVIVDVKRLLQNYNFRKVLYTFARYTVPQFRRTIVSSKFTQMIATFLLGFDFQKEKCDNSIFFFKNQQSR